MKGKRSGLFFAFCNLVKLTTPPKVILIENVTALLNSHEGRDFRVVLDVLIGLGYSVSWRVLNARYFGVPQSRPRVFICAIYGHPEIAASVMFEKSGSNPLPHEREAFMTPGVAQWKTGPIVPRVSYCLAATSGRHTGTDWSRTYVTYKHGVRRLTPRECELLQGFPAGWTLPAVIINGDEEQIDTLRYTALGNAVAVPVISWIAKRIVQQLNMIGSKGIFNRVTGTNKTNMDLIELIKKAEPTFQTSKAQAVHLTPLNEKHFTNKYKWMSAGIAFNDYCIQANIAPAPSTPIESNLFEIIEKGKVHERYYLSPNAAIGILRRVDSQGRTLFPPLRGALDYLASTVSAKKKM